jgi:hypothetical protein
MCAVVGHNRTDRHSIIEIYQSAERVDITIKAVSNFNITKENNRLSQA